MQLKSFPINTNSVNVDRIVGNLDVALQTAERGNLFVHVGADVVQADTDIGVVDNQVVHLCVDAVEVNCSVRIHADCHAACD